MIANARMYSVSPEAAGLWRRLLAAVIEHAGLDIQLLEHSEPAPIDELWQRPDKAAVFMCGLPFSRSDPAPELIAAPVPSPPDFRGLPQYWSEMVVRKDSTFHTIEDTFGGRIALTVPDSQSGCLAALYYLMTKARDLSALPRSHHPAGDAARGHVRGDRRGGGCGADRLLCLLPAAEIPPRPDLSAAHRRADGAHPHPAAGGLALPASTACRRPSLKRMKSPPFTL